MNKPSIERIDVSALEADVDRQLKLHIDTLAVGAGTGNTHAIRLLVSSCTILASYLVRRDVRVAMEAHWEITEEMAKQK